MDDLVARLCAKAACAAFVGRSPAFREIVDLLPRIAAAGTAVLIEGETGTGKEMAARALHYLSPRAGFPFIAVNGGALPDTLLEAELFGHERGAFTDAHARREGLIAQAEKGTLFLDEIDSLSRKAQVSLLRMLQEGVYRPVGGAERPADVRVVAATNAPIGELVRTGAFRADLYYRLCVFHVALPPLRRRPEDIPLLAEHFLEKHAAGDGPTPVLSPAALAVVLAHDWPGNVRELENAMIRSSRLCRGGRIEPEDLGLRAAPAAAAPGVSGR